MARGGRRLGAGRKPIPRAGVVLTLTGRREPPAALAPATPITPITRITPIKPPPGMPAAARGPWRRLAPLAIAERTLTPATAAGFAQLCCQWAYLVELQTTIARLGAGTREADGYLKQYGRLAQRLDASLARFKLTADGKPAAPAPVATVNPWARVAPGNR
jgi:hypothetical protein